MADKEAILATLNIKAMTFDDTFSALTKSTIDKDIVYIYYILSVPTLALVGRSGT